MKQTMGVTVNGPTSTGCLPKAATAAVAATSSCSCPTDWWHIVLRLAAVMDCCCWWQAIAVSCGRCTAVLVTLKLASEPDGWGCALGYEGSGYGEKTSPTAATIQGHLNDDRVLSISQLCCQYIFMSLSEDGKFVLTALLIRCLETEEMSLSLPLYHRAATFSQSSWMHRSMVYGWITTCFRSRSALFHRRTWWGNNTVPLNNICSAERERERWSAFYYLLKSTQWQCSFPWANFTHHPAYFLPTTSTKTN